MLAADPEISPQVGSRLEEMAFRFKAAVGSEEQRTSGVVDFQDEGAIIGEAPGVQARRMEHGHGGLVTDEESVASVEGHGGDAEALCHFHDFTMRRGAVFQGGFEEETRTELMNHRRSGPEVPFIAVGEDERVDPVQSTASHQG